MILAARSTTYDVAIVGAGPAGATTAFFLAQAGAGFRVALLDKAVFPRDKVCGDAWCAPALDILEEMNVLQELEADGLVRDTASGGFVSPSGESYISTGANGGAPGTRCYAIKRSICDERIARRAAQNGAELFEAANASRAELERDGLWTIRCSDGRVFRARILVAADGANSRLARSLGVVRSAPQAVAARQYIRGGTHNFKSGGVLFYPHYILPGYVALFRHYDDDIDVGSYVIPGGSLTSDRLRAVYEREIRHDPFVQRALGPRAEPRERVRIAPIRLGGEARSTAKQFLAVGDAAGQTDPLTGEGIHTGMIGGKLAAEIIVQMLHAGDMSESACSAYHARWMAAFGRDFYVSALGARMICRLPLLLDAANVVAQRRGDAFMTAFGAAMTGVAPKTRFLKPDVALPMTLEIIRQLVVQKLSRRFSISRAYDAQALAADARDTSFANACLLRT